MAFTLSRPARRTVLALHVLFGVGWMGLDVGLAVLLVTGLTTGDGPTAAAAYTAARVIIPPVVPVLAIGMLVTGVLLGVGTRWGLARWTWVLSKLVIGIVLTMLVFVALLPGVLGIPEGLVAAGGGDAVRERVGDERVGILFPPFVSFSALGVSLVLSIWKPGGRTRWAEGAPERPVATTAQSAGGAD